MILSWEVHFSFFQKFDFPGFLEGWGMGGGGVKGQKIAKNDKKICVALYNDNISPGKMLIFWVFRRVKGQKRPKMKKTLSVTPYISRTIHHMIFMYGTHV